MSDPTVTMTIPAQACALITRLCVLQAEVSELVDGWSHANDCFCIDGSHRPAKDFRSDETSVAFIEKATRKAIRKHLRKQASA